MGVEKADRDSFTCHKRHLLGYHRDGKHQLNSSRDRGAELSVFLILWSYI